MDKLDINLRTEIGLLRSPGNGILEAMKSNTNSVRNSLAILGLSIAALNSSACFGESSIDADKNQDRGNVAGQTNSPERDYSLRSCFISTDGKNNWYAQITYPKPYILEAYVDGVLAYTSIPATGEQIVSSAYTEQQKELRLRPFEVDEQGNKIREIPIVNNPLEAKDDNILGYDYGKLR